MDTANKFSNLKALLYEKYGSVKKKKKPNFTKESKTNLNNVNISRSKGVAL